MFPITIAFGTLILTLVTLLAINTTRLRGKTPRNPTPEQKEALRRAMRTHGNNFEHGVPVILLMLFYEVSGGSATALCTVGSIYLAMRVIYSLGYLTKPGAMLQIVGAGMTYLIEIALIVMVAMAMFTTSAAG